MATNALTGTVVSQNLYNGGWVGYRSNSAYAGTNHTAYYAYILKFTAPAFVGASESVTFTLGMTKATGDTPTLRYALCKSDANKDSYANTNGAVTDANQIASGTVKTGTLSTMVTYQKITISTEKLEPGKTYYLFLWGYAPQSDPAYVTINETKYHSVSVAYNSGLIYLDDGKTVSAYQICIDNGSSWDLFIPQIANGSTWDLFS